MLWMELCFFITQPWSTPLVGQRSIGRSPKSADMSFSTNTIFNEGLLKNTLNTIAPRFWLALDGTIEEKSRHSTAMLRLFRLRRVLKMGRRGEARCPRYFLTSPKRMPPQFFESFWGDFFSDSRSQYFLTPYVIVGALPNAPDKLRTR